MIDIVMYGERHRSVHTIDRATTCVHEVPYLVVTAAFQNMGKPHNVTVDIGVGIFQRIAHSRLCSKVDNGIEIIFGKQCFQGWPVVKISVDESEGGLSLQPIQAGLF